MQMETYVIYDESTNSKGKKARGNGHSAEPNAVLVLCCRRRLLSRYNRPRVTRSFPVAHRAIRFASVRVRALPFRGVFYSPRRAFALRRDGLCFPGRTGRVKAALCAPEVRNVFPPNGTPSRAIELRNYRDHVISAIQFLAVE